MLVSFFLFHTTTIGQTLDWVKGTGGVDYDSGEAISVDDLGNVYTTGTFEGVVDFDPGAGVFNLTSNGLKDIFIQKLDAGGNFLWAKSMGGSSLYDYSASISVDNSGNVYTAGFFEGTVDFDPNYSRFYSNAIGKNDFFVQKLSPCPSNIDVVCACSSYTWIDGKQI